MIEVKAFCEQCGGTGLYSGCCESPEIAIVCSRCHGTGCVSIRYEPFTLRQPAPSGIARVLERNPGIKAGRGNGYVPEDFGGMPIANWLEGHKFVRGSEMRKFCCPARWSYELSAWCPATMMAGLSYTDCEKFKTKDDCWRCYDRQVATLMRSYIETALWSSELSADLELSEQAKETIERDCIDFLRRHGFTDSELDMAGHDFWLARNGHGTGFWDNQKCWIGSRADSLTKLARSFNAQDLYVGDDGLVYVG